MASITSYWPKQIRRPTWIQEWEIDATSWWKELQSHVVGGVHTEGKIIAAIFVNVLCHQLTELLRFLTLSDSLKSSAIPNLMFYSRLRSHPNTQTSTTWDGPWCAFWLLGPLPCHFLRILNISSIWPSLIGGLLICMKVYNLPSVITPLTYSLEKKNLIVDWFNLQWQRA